MWRVQSQKKLFLQELHGSLELKISGALPKISLAPSCFKGCHLTLWTRWEGWKSHSCEGRIRSQLKYRKAVQILPFACWIFATLCCVCTDREAKCWRCQFPVRALRRSGSRWSPPCWSQVALAMWQRALAMVTRCDKMWKLYLEFSRYLFPIATIWINLGLARFSWMLSLFVFF